VNWNDTRVSTSSELTVTSEQFTLKYTEFNIYHPTKQPQSAQPCTGTLPTYSMHHSALMHGVPFPKSWKLS
jgi:hypothetical protein